MGFIIDFFIKVTGFRKFFSISLFALRLTFLLSWLAFYVSLAVAIGHAYDAFWSIFSSFSNSSLGGVYGQNDINAIAWSLIDALGITDVLTNFLPIVFSMVVMYLSLYLVGIVLSFQERVYKSLVDAGIIFLG